MNLRDELVYTTVRIESVIGETTGRGTGFFMNFRQKGETSVPAIVTNKHVIAGAASGHFFFTAQKPGIDAPDLGNLIPVSITNFEQVWFLHPDPTIDLAVFPLAETLRFLEQQGKRPFFRRLAHDMIADNAYMSRLTAIEDVLMIGYPIGLWDSKHNLPIVRRGITATPPFVDFDGLPQFVIDAACFPGSSGSPVFLFNEGSYPTKEGGVMLASARVKLLGVLYAGPQHTTQGELHVSPIPTATQTVSISRIPANLGYCIKAEQLEYFEEKFRDIEAKS